MAGARGAGRRGASSAAAPRTGTPIRVDDIRSDRAPPDATWTSGGHPLDAVRAAAGAAESSASSRRSPRAAASFTAHHQRVLEAFAEQAGIAIHNARLFEESRARAGDARAPRGGARRQRRASTSSRTIRLILEQARDGARRRVVRHPDARSGDPASWSLSASLDLPDAIVDRVRIPEGEGITGRAVQERRPVPERRPLERPAGALSRSCALASGLRSMLAAPLLVGDRAIGAISVLPTRRPPVHAAEEEIAGRARRPGRDRAGARPALRRELRGDGGRRGRASSTSQKRFVEVVLETLPLGVFVLDAGLGVVRANRRARALLALRRRTARGRSLSSSADARAAAVQAFLRAAFAGATVTPMRGGDDRGRRPQAVRLRPRPCRAGRRGGRMLVLLVEDITLPSGSSARCCSPSG